jgi:hypothetical protein
MLGAVANDCLSRFLQWQHLFYIAFVGQVQSLFSHMSITLRGGQSGFVALAGGDGTAWRILHADQYAPLRIQIWRNWAQSSHTVHVLLCIRYNVEACAVHMQSCAGAKACVQRVYNERTLALSSSCWFATVAVVCALLQYVHRQFVLRWYTATGENCYCITAINEDPTLYWGEVNSMLTQHTTVCTALWSTLVYCTLTYKMRCKPLLYTASRELCHAIYTARCFSWQQQQAQGIIIFTIALRYTCSCHAQLCVTVELMVEWLRHSTATQNL